MLKNFFARMFKKSRKNIDYTAATFSELALQDEFLYGGVTHIKVSEHKGYREFDEHYTEFAPETPVRLIL